MPAGRYNRLHAGDRADDARDAGQRDRDRVLYTSALRRLGAVTQVVSPVEGVLFHNRLTHSLEVAQLGRRMAERLTSDEVGRKLARAAGGIDPDVVEAAALIHDLGHPPFGHAVEKVLDKLVKGADVADGFEGNPQSFRIVTKLATRHTDFQGLNLCRATLNAVLKYPWLRQTSGRRHQKWGPYSTEQQEFDWARAMHDSGDDSRSIEAELMDWADDIAYAVHDVEDLYRAGRKQLKDNLADAFMEVIGAGPTLEPYRATRFQRAGLRTYTAGRINNYVNAVKVDPEQGPGKRLQVASAARDQVNVLKQLTRVYVIDDPSLETQQYGQRRAVRELFGIYHGAASTGYDLGVFPVSYREQIEATDGAEERVRIVGDLMSSMTEQQLLRTYQRLTGIDPGSVMDLM